MSPPNDPATGRRVVDPSVYSVEFRPRASGRRLVGLLTLVGIAATAYTGWTAYQEKTTVAYGVAATVAALTIILWAAWASASVAHLHVHGGVLEVQRAGKTERFDLTSGYTVLRVEGSARSSRWKVLIERPANDPFVINRSMVDPKAFMRVLQAYHHAV